MEFLLLDNCFRKYSITLQKYYFLDPVKSGIRYDSLMADLELYGRCKSASVFLVPYVLSQEKILGLWSYLSNQFVISRFETALSSKLCSRLSIWFEILPTFLGQFLKKKSKVCIAACHSFCIGHCVYQWLAVLYLSFFAWFGVFLSSLDFLRPLRYCTKSTFLEEFLGYNFCRFCKAAKETCAWTYDMLGCWKYLWSVNL